jgi:hypothetical protein
MAEAPAETYRKRIDELKIFRKAVRKLEAAQTVGDPRLRELAEALSGRGPEQELRVGPELREQINRSIPRMRNYLEDAGEIPVVQYYPPPMVGGPVVSFNLLENIFVNLDDRGIRPGLLLDWIDRAIGFYEELVESGETIAQRGLAGELGLVSALQQRLRPMFRKEPADEKEVQEKVEDLLIAREVSYSREKESFQYSSKGYIPDFVLSATRTALEIKLCKPGREPTIIAQINDDILAYKTQYKNQIFLVYDLGAIRDDAKFRGDLETHGAVVIVVKH